MFLIDLSRTALRQVLVRLLLVWLMCSVLALSTLSAWGQAAGGMSPAPGSGIVWKICDPPPICFGSKEAKEEWAKARECRFIEEVCEKTTPEQDKHGAKEADKSFWGALWDSVKGGLTYGYEFVKGLYAGLKDQVADLVHLFTNAADVVQGLIQLGKAFFVDPKGTLASLGELLGQEAVDAITKATQCGAFDLGKVVATYVNPYFAVKLAQRLTKYGGKLAEASKAVKRDYGCVSFAAGTLVLSASGLVPIEQITVGQLVLSRNDSSYADRPQAVTYTTSRQASGYQQLVTEGGSYRVTGEHPVWLQGKGWTPAAQVQAGDVLAGERLDSVVVSNQAVAQPLRVYNFSVGWTPSYFVGSAGIWVHNVAKCSLDIYTKRWNDLTKEEKGFRGEVIVLENLIGHKYEPVAGSFDYRGKSPTDAYAARAGMHTLDGVLKNPNGKYVLIESKATGGTSKSDPEGCVDRLCKLKNDDRQMSKKYILERLQATVSDPVERQKIIDGLEKDDGSVTRVYAQIDARGPIYNVITETAEDGVKIGKKWNP
jgi:hypothetical protein